MTARLRHLTTPVAGLALAVGLSCPAVAFEASDVAARLAESLGKSGYQVAWSAMNVNGDMVVLEGVTASVVGVDEKIEVGAVVLDGVGEDGNGAYVIETVSLPDYSKEKDGIKVSFSGASLQGLVLPPEDAEKTLRSILPYSAMALAAVNVTGPGGEIFSMSNFKARMDVPDDGSQADYTTTIEAFTLNSAAFPEAQARATFAALGYTTLEGSLDSYGKWTPEDGRMTIDKMALTVEDAGTLDINLDIAGYTYEFVESLQAMQKKMMEEGENQNTGLAMLGLMQQISFNSARIRFDDNSLTNKVLEFVAMQQGMRPSDIANQAKAVLPFALAKLNNPEFATQVTLAVSAFLDDPRSIEIVANPGMSLPIALLIAGGMNAPEQLPTQLGVKVLANK
ncbi:MAG: hypothetical protein R3D45_03180 [Rhizobiaceae bacterium]